MNAGKVVLSFAVIAAFMLVSAPLAVAADKAKNKIYKCEKDGVVTYSQLSCADDADVVNVKMSQGRPDDAARKRTERRQQEVAEYVKQQDKTRAISRHEAAVARYKKQMAEEFAQMQQQRYRSVQQKNQAIDALSKKYNALILIEHEAIKALHESK